MCDSFSVTKYLTIACFTAVTLPNFSLSHRGRERERQRQVDTHSHTLSRSLWLCNIFTTSDTIECRHTHKREAANESTERRERAGKKGKGKERW